MTNQIIFCTFTFVTHTYLEILNFTLENEILHLVKMEYYTWD